MHDYFRLLLVVVAVAVFPFEADAAAQASASQVPPISLMVDVNYDSSPPTGNPPTNQDVLSLCGAPGAGPDSHGSQNLSPDDNGNFNEIWSVTTPVVRVTGNVTPTSFSAALSCLSGPGSGSISASGDITGYAGSWTFTQANQAYTGNVSITRRCFSADAGGPYQIDYGDGLQLNGTQSNGCGTAAIGTYRWYIDGSEWICFPGLDNCGAPYLDALYMSLYAPRSNGPYPISLTFIDPNGYSTTSMTTVAVYDNRPFAIYLVTPAIAACGQQVTFNGAGSFHGDPRHGIVSYAWTFGDQSPQVFGSNVTHAYGRPGRYDFSLLVIDDQGKSGLGGTYQECSAHGCEEHEAYVDVIRSNQPPFTDEQLSPGSSLVKAAHFSELRARIDGVRARFGLGPYVYVAPGITVGAVIQAQQISEMRTALAQAYAGTTEIQPTYTDPNLANGMMIKMAHVGELRGAVVVLECRGM